jgi:hypothetical protein
MKKMKIAVVFPLLFILAAPGLISPAESGDSRNRSDEHTLVVSGIGYPPIKAENAAQARLMARRAAILDAYRNALSAAGTAGNDENAFYSGLSGFVKGLTIEKEEYLGDGGLRIIAKVRTGNVTASTAAPHDRKPERRGGPSAVPLNEWYRIIEGSVRFE